MYHYTQFCLLLKESYILAPLRSPSLDLRKTAFVTSLKADVKTPDAAKPARKDYRIDGKKINKDKKLQKLGMR